VRTPTPGKRGIGAQHLVSNRREAWKLTTSNLDESGERSKTIRKASHRWLRPVHRCGRLAAAIGGPFAAVGEPGSAGAVEDELN
jgi:hypothetical protein